MLASAWPPLSALRALLLGSLEQRVPAPLDHAPHFASAPFSSFHQHQLFNVDSRRKKRKAVHFTRAPKHLQIISAYLSNFNDDKVALLSQGQVQSCKPVHCSATSLSCPESRRQNVEGSVWWVFGSLFNKFGSPLPLLCTWSYHSAAILRASIRAISTPTCQNFNEMDADKKQ